MSRLTDSMFGMMMAAADNLKIRKSLQNIAKKNAANQGLTWYEPSQIEAFFDDGEPLENMIVSGGAGSIRMRAIVRAAECALLQGYAVLVLHGGDRELEQGLQNYFGAGYVCAVSRANPVYDPFRGAANGEIARLTIASAGKGNPIGSAGRYYLNGMSDFLRAKGLQPSVQAYINCPHLNLIDNVNNAEAQGRITSAQARTILSELMQGETERGNVESFFAELSRQAGGILASKAVLGRAVNLDIAARQQQILAVDVQSGGSAQLINLLLNEAKTVMARGTRMMIVADGLQVTAGDVMKDMFGHAGNDSFVVAADDAYAAFGGDDNAFFSFAGRCSKVIVSRHLSAHTCQKFADIIGSYEKQEISSAYGKNTNYLSHYGMGASQTVNVSTKRENIVKPEEIQRMAVDEVYIRDSATGELALVPVL